MERPPSDAVSSPVTYVFVLVATLILASFRGKDFHITVKRRV
jgi:hypothetical protein